MLGALYYHRERGRLQAEAGNALSAIADLKCSQILAWRSERLADGQAISHNPFSRLRVASYLAHSAPADSGGDILSWMETLRQSCGYYDVILHNVDLKQQLIAGPEQCMNASCANNEIGAALQTGVPCLTDLHPSTDSCFMRMSLSVPLQNPQARPGQPRYVGIMLQQIDPQRCLYPLIQRWSSPSPSAETPLVRRDGEAVLYFNTLRHRPHSPLRNRLPVVSSRRGVPACFNVAARIVQELTRAS